MALDIVLGLQWGDEGKGKIVDRIGADYHCVARFQGGPNAGHTLYRDGRKHVLHQIPSGIFHPEVFCVVGNGVIIDPVTFCREIDQLDENDIPWRDRLWLSSRAHLILPTHRLIDRMSEEAKGDDRIGSTLRGITPAYVDKYAREGVRLGDLLAASYELRIEKALERHRTQLPEALWPNEETLAAFHAAVKRLREMAILNVEERLLDWHDQGAAILAEGAQGTLLDVDFGDYPYVTSSHTLAASACIGLGLPPQAVRRVLGVLKAYATRVGNGPFPTELLDERQEQLQRLGNEFGSTTGRPRRCGWLDLELIRRAARLNGVTHLALTKLDVIVQMPEFLVKETNGAYRSFTGWVEPPDASEPSAQAKEFVEFLSDNLGLPVSFLSVGPERDAVHCPAPWA